MALTAVAALTLAGCAANVSSEALIPPVPEGLGNTTGSSDPLNRGRHATAADSLGPTPFRTAGFP